MKDPHPIAKSDAKPLEVVGVELLRDREFSDICAVWLKGASVSDIAGVSGNGQKTIRRWTRSDEMPQCRRHTPTIHEPGSLKERITQKCVTVCLIACCCTMGFVSKVMPHEVRAESARSNLILVIFTARGLWGIFSNICVRACPIANSNTKNSITSKRHWRRGIPCVLRREKVRLEVYRETRANDNRFW